MIYTKFIQILQNLYIFYKNLQYLQNLYLFYKIYTNYTKIKKYNFLPILRQLINYLYLLLF